MATRRDSRTRDQLLAEIDFLRRGGIAEQVGRTVRILIIAGACVAVAYFIGEVLISFAGKSTNAEVAVNLIGDLRVSIAIAWGAAAGGLLYGRAQRKLRGQAVERLTKRVAELETELDPRRSSS